MYNCYVVNTDNVTDKVYFTIDPIIKPLPECERQVKQYTSVMSFSYAGTIINPRTHTIDAGVPVGSGILPVTFSHLALSKYETFASKFTSKDPPIKVNFYDYRQSTLYTDVILRNLKSDYIEGLHCIHGTNTTSDGSAEYQVSGSFEMYITGYPA